MSDYYGDHFDGPDYDIPDEGDDQRDRAEEAHNDWLLHEGDDPEPTFEMRFTAEDAERIQTRVGEAYRTWPRFRLRGGGRLSPVDHDALCSVAAHAVGVSVASLRSGELAFIDDVIEAVDSEF